MNKNILKELADLKQAGIITDDVAENIRQYYQAKSQNSGNRLIIAFGILGALLTGLGIILIIAHNWDDFNKFGKLFFALAPLLIGQLLCGFTLFKKTDNQTWREACAVLLFLAVAASISIVSQVYHIHGSLERFLLVWVALSIPIIYVMKSSMTSLLTIGVATWYACEVSYFNSHQHIAWYYWLMITALFPYTIILIKSQARNFLSFHAWLLAISLTISLGMFGEREEQTLFIAYASLFCAFTIIGGKILISTTNLLSNSFLVAGNLGITILLLLLTHDFFWVEISRNGLPISTEFFASASVTLFTIGLLVVEFVQKRIIDIQPMAYIFLAIIALYSIGIYFPDLAQILTNLLTLMVGVLIIKRGAKENSLLIMNYGLLMIAALIVIRFFDSDISFVIRGILFIAIGIAFFVTNLQLVKKRKSQQL
jgi:uncharacterized membrane protein